MSYYNQQPAQVQGFQYPQNNYYPQNSYGYSVPNQSFTNIIKKHKCEFCNYRSDRKS